jgi:hypothetical protein
MTGIYDFHIGYWSSNRSHIGITEKQTTIIMKKEQRNMENTKTEKMDNKIFTAAKLHAIGLIVAALGILIEYLVGVPGFPKIPPGPIILGASGILVLVTVVRWKWILFISELAALFISVGGIIEGSSWGRLSRVGDFGPFIGTALQWIGLAVAVIAGATAIVKALSRTSV